MARRRRHVLGTTGDRPLGRVSGSVRKARRDKDDGQEKVGAPIMANRVLSLVKKMFNFALDREWIDANPARSAQASITGDTP